MTIRALAGYSVAFNRDYDERVRAAAFEWLAGKVAIHGDVLSRDMLAAGFELDQQRVPLVGPQGIFKPAVMDVPLSIATAPHGPYDDEIGYDSLLRYRYRGTDSQHRDNVGLRFAMQNKLPLTYFYGESRGSTWPCGRCMWFAINPSILCFPSRLTTLISLSSFHNRTRTPGQSRRFGGNTSRLRRYADSIKARFARGCFVRIVISAPFVVCGTVSCSMPPTSFAGQVHRFFE